MKKLTSVAVALVLAIAAFMFSGCAERVYYHEHHDHSPRYYRHHHHRTVESGIDVRIHN